MEKMNKRCLPLILKQSLDPFKSNKQFRIWAILSEYNITYEIRACISHVYQVQMTSTTKLYFVIPLYSMWLTFLIKQSVSQLCIFWLLRRNFHLRGSCCCLSKTTHKVGKLLQTTERCSIISLFGLGAHS